MVHAYTSMQLRKQPVNVRFGSAIASFMLLAWEGKNPTWSVIDSALIDSTLEPGESTPRTVGEEEVCI